MRRLPLLLVVIAISILFAGCSPEETTTPQEDPQVAAGKALFEENCAGCHPRSGRGDYLKRIPVTLLTRKNQQELMDWIEGAGQHREMPSFTFLTEEEREALAIYLHSQVGR